MNDAPRGKPRGASLVLALAFGLIFLGARVWAQNISINRTLPTVQTAPVDPNVHAINQIILKQMKQIKKDHKLGNLTKEQAKALMYGIETIRKKELQFFQLNGKKIITNDQKYLLEQMINDNANSQ